MMKHICILYTVGMLASASGAEVITGDFGPDRYLDGDSLTIDELDITFFQNSAGGGFSSIDIRPSFNNPVPVVMLTSGNTNGGGFSEFYFMEGQQLADFDRTLDSIRLLFVKNGKGGGVVESMGFVGEYQYLGFQLTGGFGNSGRGAAEETHFGFIQVEKVGDTLWKATGWAYETEANKNLVVFNTVPTPSGLALLGAGGLFMTCRCRD